MASKYSSAFDDLLASGRQQLDALADRPSDRPQPTPAAAVRAEVPVEERRRGRGAVIEGTSSGIPFRLRVR